MYYYGWGYGFASGLRVLKGGCGLYRKVDARCTQTVSKATRQHFQGSVDRKSTLINKLGNKMDFLPDVCSNQFRGKDWLIHRKISIINWIRRLIQINCLVREGFQYQNRRPEYKRNMGRVVIGVYTIPRLCVELGVCLLRWRQYMVQFLFSRYIPSRNAIIEIGTIRHA